MTEYYKCIHCDEDTIIDGVDTGHDVAACKRKHRDEEDARRLAEWETERLREWLERQERE